MLRRVNLALYDTFLRFLSGREAACARSFSIFSSRTFQCVQVVWCRLKGPGLSQCPLHGGMQVYRDFITVVAIVGAGRMFVRGTSAQNIIANIVVSTMQGSR